MNILNNFTVIEGLDKSGKTTFAKTLINNLEKNNIDYFLTSEPTVSPLGKIIRQNLKHNFDNKTMSLLFSADRNEHVKEFSKIKKQIICDRYIFSSLAYQSVDFDYEFVKSINKDYPLPKTLFFLNTDFYVIKDRIERAAEKDYYENIIYLEKVYENYQKVIKEFSNRLEVIEIYNNIFDIDDIIKKYYAPRLL